MYTKKNYKYQDPNTNECVYCTYDFILKCLPFSLVLYCFFQLTSADLNYADSLIIQYLVLNCAIRVMQYICSRGHIHDKYILE